MNRFQLIYHSVISGLLLSAPWLFSQSGLLLLFAFVPLLRIEQYIHRSGSENGTRKVFLLSSLTFIIWNTLTTWWIGHAAVGAAVTAVLVNTFLMAAIFSLFHITKKKIKSFSYLIFMAFWTGFEYLYFRTEISWPWLTLGNGLANDIHFIQWYEYTGVLGGTCWILLSNILIYRISYADNPVRGKKLITNIALVIIPVIISLTIYHKHQKPEEPENLEKSDETAKMEETGQFKATGKLKITGKPEETAKPEKTGNLEKNQKFEETGRFENTVKPEDTGRPAKTGKFKETAKPEICENPAKPPVTVEGRLEVSIIQPNLDPYAMPPHALNDEEKMTLFRSFADTLSSYIPHIIALPEVYFDAELWENDIHHHSFTKRFRRYIQNNPNNSVLTGIRSYRAYFQDQAKSNTAKYSEKLGHHYDVYNTACYIAKNQGVQLRHKSRLVLGVEKVPYPDKLKFLGRLSARLGGISGSNGVDKHPVLFSLENAQFGTLICYESVYGNYVRQFVKNGGQLLFVLTNDGWWNNTPGHRQHLSYSRLRAIENRKYVARSAYNGISCFINTKGEILQQIGYGEKGAISTTVPLNTEKTFYTSNGDYIGRIAVFVSVLLLLYLMVHLLKKSDLVF